MTNLEWGQLQHYERWRKRLQEDPYKTLFGASNDMLSGKGLKDWEWVHKTFPKWMLRDMDVDETPQVSKNYTSAPTSYSKKVELRDHNDGVPKPRETHFPEPSFRTRRFERDGTSGIVSPSDLRRPQEEAHVKVVGKASRDVATDANTTSAILASDGATIFVPPPPSPHTPYTIDGSGMENSDANRVTARSVREEAAARESSFIEEFLSNRSEQPVSSSTKEERSNVWRETALQRCAASGLMAKPPSRPSLVAKPASDTPSSTLESVSESTGAPDARNNRSLKSKSKNVEWLIQQESAHVSNKGSSEVDTNAPRPPAQILNQLPEDDIDFLSAADIRATMGAKRSRLPTNEQRRAERENLEKAFAAAQDLPQSDSIAETAVINNQLVRRAERQIRESQLAQEMRESDPIKGPENEVATPEAPLESSIDRMKRWLETTGASFAKQFWQDPTEEADVTKTRLFFDKAAHYLKKGQAATRQITDDLEKDIPASKALLRRLKSDEETVDLAIHRLRQRSSSDTAQGLSPRKIRHMESLKVRFHQTNNELEKAYEELRALAGTDSVRNATGSFKRRLTVASKVLHKNAQLLRMLIWSLQARLEDSDMDRRILPNYKVVADNLLSLRDTQMTLMRLVERAMLVYGVAPQSADGHNPEATKAVQTQLDNCEEPFIRARLAADAHLINEINAHKTAMQGLSDDGYSHALKQSKTSTLEEPSPLAHSLFRPFGPAIDKLGTEDAPDLTAARATEEEQRKRSDAKLVAEIKQAYEDTYGPITADHAQVASEPKCEEHEAWPQKNFAMLKEDPTGRPSIEWVASSDIKPKTSSSSSMTPAVADATGTPEFVDNAEVEKDSSVKTTTSNEASLPSGEVEAKPTASFNGTPEIQNADSAATPCLTGEVEDQPTVFSHATSGDKVVDPVQTLVTPSTVHLPTYYTILVRDPQTDTLSIATSSTGPPRDSSPALPLHQALAALDSPAKFIPYITSGLEVVSANKDILVLRDAIDSTASASPFETINAPNSETSYAEGRTVNPIDGTARLSPTGYVGPEESAEHLEREFEERRQAAGRFKGKDSERDEKPRKERKWGGAGVVKTAIWVAGVCYVAGVMGEIASAS
tara:strand:- start:35518 stop:38844 length:3327 start_codon:yes stop_codon:yes gene_type:complete